jgi:hypothetical protein
MACSARQRGDTGGVGGASGGGKSEGNPTRQARVTGYAAAAFSHVNEGVAGTGFEPVKAMPAILQTAPFGRSGTLPDEAG